MKHSMTTVSSSAKEELPYERFMKNGPESLSDAELLAIILRTGTTGESAVEVARKILALPGGRHEGLLGLHHMTMQELTGIRGIGQVKAVKLMCIAELSNRMAHAISKQSIRFTNPETVAACYMERLRHKETEQAILIMTDGRNQLIEDMTISQGTVNASLISPREIFIHVLRCKAVNMLLVHNHPSGDASPSREDEHLTERLKEAAKLLGIGFVDHIIIGDKQYTSMRQLGFLSD